MNRLKRAEIFEKLLPLKGDEIPQALFPDIYEIEKLKLEIDLPVLVFENLQAKQLINKNLRNVIVKVPAVMKPVDVFLFINHKKFDMYYKACEGIYNFKHVPINLGENLLEAFYRLGNKKSLSIYSIIQKKKSGKQNEKLSKH